MDFLQISSLVSERKVSLSLCYFKMNITFNKLH